MKKILMLWLILVFTSGCTIEHDAPLDEHMEDGEHIGPMAEMEDHHGVEETPLFAEFEVDKLVAAEVAELRFHITDHQDEPVINLMVHHGRKVHVLIIGEDVATFAHIHPEDFGSGITPEMEAAGAYSVKYTFPQAGTYLVALEVMNPDSTLSKQFMVEVGGDDALDAVVPDMGRIKYFTGVEEQGEDRYVDPYMLSSLQGGIGKGYRVTFDAPQEIKAGEEFTISYRFELGEEEVTDLEPFLDAAMHFVIVRDDLGALLHWHGRPRGMSDQGGEMIHDKVMETSSDGHDEMVEKEDSDMMHLGANVPGAFGPDLEGTFTLEKPGRYQVFGQVNHQGKIIPSWFMIEVEDAE
ncbi:MAG: PKD domain-containing protein [Nanoarchaeota archaeon]|nr:PKD domain-containing protein [Nanoarchaeota archaeon]